MFSRLEAHLRVVCLRAHCNDIAVDCGDTILDLFARRTDVQITEAVFGGRGFRAAEVELDDFRDGP